MGRTFLVPALLALCLVSRALPVTAQQPAPSPYDAALERSLAAHAVGDYAGAELAMREAHALFPNARTLRGLGVILYAEGRYVEAVAPLEAALASADKPLSAELRTGVVELLSRIWQRVGRLSLRIEPSDSLLTVDGAAPLPHGEREVLLSAGEHALRISAPGREPYELTLRTQAGSRDSLHVVLATRVDVPPPGPVSAIPSPSSNAARSDRRWSPVVRNSLFAASAAVALAGAASYLTGYLRFKELEKDCRRDDCGDRDQRIARFKRERIEPLTATGVVLMATGAAALLTVGSIELWQRRTRVSRRPQLSLTPWGAQLRHQF